jgi:hypothetical protein
MITFVSWVTEDQYRLVASAGVRPNFEMISHYTMCDILLRQCGPSRDYYDKAGQKRGSQNGTKVKEIAKHCSPWIAKVPSEPNA